MSGSRRIRLAVLAGVLLVATSAVAWNPFGEEEQEPEAGEWKTREEPATTKEIRELGLDPATVGMLDEVAGSPALNLFARGGESPMRIGLFWEVESTRAEEVRAAMRERAKDPLYRFFFTERRWGTGPDRLALVRAHDPLAPVELQGTPGEGEATSPEELRSWLGTRRQTLDFDLVGVGPDWVEVELDTLPDDLDAFVAEVERMAPAAVPTEPAGREALRTRLRSTRRLLLWWE